MNAINFAYWLQGYLEIASAEDNTPELSYKQVAMIQRHLNLVFAHDIDPKTEPEPKKAAELQKLHDVPHRPNPFDPNIVYRC